MTKGNLIENWDGQYQPLDVTYTEKLSALTIGQITQYELVHADLVEFLPDLKKPDIVEVGCGGARTSLYLARRGFNVTCTDNSENALTLARRNFEAFNANGNILCDDLLKSKIPPESADCVMSFGLLEHFEDLRPVISSMSQMVKRGGIQIHIIIPAKTFSTMHLHHAVWFPVKFLHLALKKREFKDIIRKSGRNFPHYENQFWVSDYCRAFENAGNTILRTTPACLLDLLLILPKNAGQILIDKLPERMNAIFRWSGKTQSKFAYLLAPAFKLVCRKL